MNRRIGANRRLGAESLESRQLLHGGPLGGAEEPPTVAEQVESAFERFDENDDATLTQDEVSERLWERISEADADENGAISTDELTAHVEARAEERAENGAEDGTPDNGQPDRCERGGGARQSRGGGIPTEEQIDELFANYDVSEDGLITSEEVSERLWERLSAADLNEDGVSSEELLTFQEARRQEQFDALVGRLDANEDGGLTEDEVSERKWTRVSEADTDDDGSITSQELKDYFEARHAEREAQEEVGDESEGESEIVEGGGAIAVGEANGNGGRVVRANRGRGRRS